MKVRAIVDMVGCDFEEWQIFFDSYQAERSRFVKNETVIQTGINRPKWCLKFSISMD